MPSHSFNNTRICSDANWSPCKVLRNTTRQNSFDLFPWTVMRLCNGQRYVELVNAYCLNIFDWIVVVNPFTTFDIIQPGALNSRGPLVVCFYLFPTISQSQTVFLNCIVLNSFTPVASDIVFLFLLDESSWTLPTFLATQKRHKLSNKGQRDWIPCVRGNVHNKCLNQSFLRTPRVNFL